MGSIVFSPLAQGMLTTKYLKDIPRDSRASQHKSLNPDFLSEGNLANIRALNDIAAARGQTLAQMAIAWVLRKKEVTSALIGASKPEQVTDCAGAIENLKFTEEELIAIDRYAQDGAINIWAKSAELE
jgi:L-glyceraldehyde 3-phosphate reductase